MRLLPTSAHDVRLDMDLPRRSDRKVDVGSTNRTGGLDLCERRGIQYRDLPGGRFVGGIKDDLEITGDEPVLVDSVVGFRGENVQADVVRFAVGENGDEGCEVDEVRWKLKCTVGCDWSTRKLWVIVTC